jgi:RNA polymerase sigma-70 factor, ECF subfamily
VTAEQRFEQIYAAHADVVHRYALRRISRSAAEDVVAEVFLIAWRRLSELPPEPRGWLLGTARRVVANTHRGDARRAALRERIATGGAVASEAAGGSSLLALALLELSELDREALTLIAWDGLSHREAAEALGVREGTFAVRLLRARRRLARQLGRTPVRQSTATTLETR